MLIAKTFILDKHYKRALKHNTACNRNKPYMTTYCICISVLGSETTAPLHKNGYTQKRSQYKFSVNITALKSEMSQVQCAL